MSREKNIGIMNAYFQTLADADYEAFAKEVIEKIPDKPVSFEVFSDELNEMEKEARIIISWGGNTYIKIPIMNTRGESTCSLINKLSNEGFSLNVTAVFTIKQVKEIFENIILENRLSLYSDYLDKPQNIDFDCTFNFLMRVNEYISTNLIFQFVYDDNEINRVQIREVLGVGLNFDLSKIRI